MDYASLDVRAGAGATVRWWQRPAVTVALALACVGLGVSTLILAMRSPGGDATAPWRPPRSLPPAVPAAEVDLHLRQLRPASMYEKRAVKAALVGGEALVWMADLHQPNPATARSIARASPVASILRVDADAIDAADVAALNFALESSGAMLLGEVRNASDHLLKQKLDAGLQGVMLRDAERLADVQRLLSRVFFPPMPGGHRPVGPGPASNYLQDFDALVHGANDVVFAGASIGTAAGLHSIEDIAAAAANGLNFVFIETHRLAQSLGTPPESDEFRAARRRILAACAARGVRVGEDVDSFAQAAARRADGVRLLRLGGDAEALRWALETWAGGLARDPAQEAPPGVPCNGSQARAWLHANLSVPIGFLMSYDVGAAATLAQGTSGLWVDAEHGTFTLPQVLDLVRRLAPTTCVFVRVGDYAHPWIAPALAAGAAGVVAPSVDDDAQARAFVQAVRAAAPDALAVVMIETANPVRHPEVLGAILDAAPDVVHLGPYDLSLQLNVSMSSAEQAAAIALVEAAARARGIPLGGFNGTRRGTYEGRARGYRFVTTVSDQEGVVNYFRAAFAPLAPPTLRVVRNGQQDAQGRYAQAAAVLASQLAWEDRGDGAFAQRFAFGDAATLQVVRKPGTARVGQRFSHAHAQGQVTALLAGRSRVQIGDAPAVDLQAGDFVFIPPGATHTFYDESTDIHVVDVLLPAAPARR